ncbi:9469_t:CDS:2 [Dentiscutata erythropus]|uniref:9469_t:CDS:1 n=1 Tax=Dentiscutata erythropus TaxID=1348616 RepID=A0A9N8Z6K4_9GLOM|nr:9469_t:CDS:2 [Dentiscutata erythropus]
MEDTTLSALCNSVGAMIMALIIAYHYVVVNDKDPSEGEVLNDSSKGVVIKDSKFELGNSFNTFTKMHL